MVDGNDIFDEKREHNFKIVSIGSLVKVRQAYHWNIEGYFPENKNIMCIALYDYTTKKTFLMRETGTKWYIKYKNRYQYLN